MPTVSVLMPTYNCADFVVDAALSVLGQTYTDLELLVIDDGSSDGTIARLTDRIDDPRLRIIEGCENKGLPARLNELLDIAQGDFIARMDGDDVSYPNRIARQVEFLERATDVDLVACAMCVINNGNELVGKNRIRGLTHDEITRRPWRGLHMNHGTWLARRSFFDQNRYNATALFVEDEEILLRSAQGSRYAMLPEVHYAYRVDRLNASKIVRTRFNYVRMLMKRAVFSRSPILLLAAPDQALKALVDTIVIGLGLERRVLGHRFGTPTPLDHSQWAIVRDKISGQSKTNSVRQA